MNMNRTIGGLLGTLLLLLGTGNAAWAVDYNGTLDFSALSIPVTIPTPYGNVNGTAGLDLDRYDLGSGLSGPVAITFTTHNSFATPTGGTTLGVLFATNPNDAIFNNPTSLAGLLTPGVDIKTFLNDHVSGWQFLALGTAIIPGGTTNISAIFNPPISFTAGTTYYAFVAGGSAINSTSHALTDPSVGYTLSVNAVPEPEAWAMMAVGLGLVALRLRRRAGTALA
jgi:hypothetical protein